MNKMDRTGADFFASVQSMVDRLGAKPVPVQLPIGQEENFRGVVDVVEMRAKVWLDELGMQFEEQEIPPELNEQAQEYHHQLIDAVAEHDEELLETYLMDEEAVTPEMIRRALRKATLEIAVTPVLLGSAFKNKGVQPLLDAVVDYLPSPLDIPPIHGLDPRTEHELSAAGPGRALRVPVVQGHVRPVRREAHVHPRVLGDDQDRRPGAQHAHRAHRADRPDPADAQTIARSATRSPRVRSRPSSGSRTRPRATRSPSRPPDPARRDGLPEPVISVAIEPKTKGDQDKLATALQRLTEEDPTFRVRTDEETGQTLISGMGELHLEIFVDRMTREFNVDANVGRPQVAYRETITKPVQKIEGRFVRQTGRRGQYGHVYLDLEPSEPGEGYEFLDKIVGGSVPRSTSRRSIWASRRRWSRGSSPAARSSTSAYR